MPTRPAARPPRAPVPGRGALLPCALALALALAGCAGSPVRSGSVAMQAPVNESSGCFAPPPNLHAAYNRSYRVLGQDYTPLHSAAGYDVDGTASWYGWESGKTTSMGSRFNPRAFTAASRVLPLPTCVEVTNLRNGRSALVLVNDRGPFVDSRVMDLSYGAAKALGVTTSGTAPVRIVALASGQMLPPQMATPPSPAPTGAQPAPAQAFEPQTRFPGEPPLPPTPTAAPGLPASSMPATSGPTPASTPLPAAPEPMQVAALPPLQAAASAPAAPAPRASDALARLIAATAGTAGTAGTTGAPAAPAAGSAATAASGPAVAAASGPATAVATYAAAPAPAQAQAPMPAGAPQTYLQTGAFTIEANARLEASRLQRAGVGPVEVVPGYVRGRTWYKVQVGPLPAGSRDTVLRQRLAGLGLRDYTFVQQ